jgi:hypothetical protein
MLVRPRFTLLLPVAIVRDLALAPSLGLRARAFPVEVFALPLRMRPDALAAEMLPCEPLEVLVRAPDPPLRLLWPLETRAPPPLCERPVE